MLGQMQDVPLLISSLIRHADRHHGTVEIVSRRTEGDIHRTTYSQVHARAQQLAHALDRLGIAAGERVGTIAWNGYRHLELYYGVSGKGSIIHTINPRLPPDQVVWITRHAEDAALFFDLTFLPLIEKIAAQCTTVRHFVLMTDRAHMPATSAIPGLLCFDELIAGESERYDWPVFDENSASSMCYTSGTTGNPKGVLYSHRSTLLHTFSVALPDTLSVSAHDVLLPVVPMFHVNAWGLPYAATMVGAKLVFPGPALDGKSLHELMEAEKVTVSGGVPTIWQGMLAYVEQHKLGFSTMRRTVIGGSALPPAMLRTFEEQYNVQALHAWGMTEMSPLGTACTLRAKHDGLDREALYAVKAKQGHAIFGVDMKIVDPDGRELPWDGVASGDLLVRGPWIVANYFRGDGGDPLVTDASGLRWFPDRRCGDDRRRWLYADHRPQQGCDQVGGRVDQLDRHREHRRVASGCRDGRLHRHRPSQVGRAAIVGGGAKARVGCQPRGNPASFRRQGGQVAGARRRRLHRRHSAGRDRQDAEEQAARAIQGSRAARRRLGLRQRYPHVCDSARIQDSRFRPDLAVLVRCRRGGGCLGPLPVRASIAAMRSRKLARRQSA